MNSMYGILLMASIFITQSYGGEPPDCILPNPSSTLEDEEAWVGATLMWFKPGDTITLFQKKGWLQFRNQALWIATVAKAGNWKIEHVEDDSGFAGQDSGSNIQDLLDQVVEELKDDSKYAIRQRTLEDKHMHEKIHVVTKLFGDKIAADKPLELKGHKFCLRTGNWFSLYGLDSRDASNLAADKQLPKRHLRADKYGLDKWSLRYDSLGGKKEVLVSMGNTKAIQDEINKYLKTGLWQIYFLDKRESHKLDTIVAKAQQAKALARALDANKLENFENNLDEFERGYRMGYGNALNRLLKNHDF